MQSDSHSLTCTEQGRCWVSPRNRSVLEGQGITPPTKRHKGGQDKSIATDWLNVPASELDKTEKSTTLIPVKTGY